MTTVFSKTVLTQTWGYDGNSRLITATARGPQSGVTTPISQTDQYGYLPIGDPPRGQESGQGWNRDDVGLLLLEIEKAHAGAASALFIPAPADLSSYDLNSRETLETRLGVFAQFQPRIPDKFRDAKFVFLGNIDPELQLNVLDQVKQPKLVACDTMNYWIQGKKDLLLELLRHIDILMVNDSEARELSGDWNVYRAAHWILGRGPKMVVIKQGEHGALLVDPDTTFKVPAYPLQQVFDPTGAGDAFAGGFMAHVARTGDLTFPNLRRAMVYGSAMGSLAVEAFGVQRLEQITLQEVRGRVKAFRDLVHFSLDGEE